MVPHLTGSAVLDQGPDYHSFFVLDEAKAQSYMILERQHNTFDFFPSCAGVWYSGMCRKRSDNG